MISMFINLKLSLHGYRNIMKREVFLKLNVFKNFLLRHLYQLIQLESGRIFLLL